jgi:hypothetical protein
MSSLWTVNASAATPITLSNPISGYFNIPTVPSTTLVRRSATNNNAIIEDITTYVPTIGEEIFACPSEHITYNYKGNLMAGSIVGIIDTTSKSLEGATSAVKYFERNTGTTNYHDFDMANDPTLIFYAPYPMLITAESNITYSFTSVNQITNLTK